MEEDLDRCFKRREELLRKMEETMAALTATAEQVREEDTACSMCVHMLCICCTCIHDSVHTHTYYSNAGILKLRYVRMYVHLHVCRQLCLRLYT